MNLISESNRQAEERVPKTVPMSKLDPAIFTGAVVGKMYNKV
ncbi:MAG: hypothetical protein ACKOED_15755 [Aestuariivirga sp.]